MSTHFVLRSHDVGPAGKHVRTLDADTVLGWFRAARARIAGRPADFDPARSALQVADHLAQLRPQVGGKPGMFHRWIVFDDLWAGANPDLAGGILRDANRWDVLTA